MQVIQSAHAQYKRANRSAMVEAAKSVGQTIGLLAGTAALGAGALWYVAREGRANPAIATAGLLGTAVAGALTAARAVDAKQDVDLWLALNNGERRAQFTTGMFTAQAEAMTRLSTVWADNAIASNAWQLQQWQQSQTPRPLPQTVEAEAVPVATVPELLMSYDLAQDLGQNPQSAAIIGVPGAGKGMLVSNAIRHLKQRHPSINIMVLDPKDDPKERGYWEGFGATVCRFKFMGKDPDTCALWYLDRLEQFANMPSPKLLIGDEGTALIATLENATPKLRAIGRHKAFISHLASMGDSGETWFWLMAQSANLKDLGISGGVRSIFRAIALVSPKNKNAVEALLSTDFVPLPEGGKAGVYRLMELSEVNRAFYDGKVDRWMPSPRLQNHSGYDRDSRQALPGANVATPLPTTPEAQTLERIWNDSPDFEPEPKQRPESKLTKLMDYLERNASTAPLPRRRLLRNWANNHGVNAQTLDEMLITLIECRHIVETSDGLVWQG